jgi:hypothetical protein
MTDFTNVVRIGSKQTYNGRYYSVYCSIKYNAGALSITGVEGPLSGGICLGGCGQIVNHIKPIKRYAKGWNKKLLDKFIEVWHEYHLNDLCAGTREQEECIKKYGATNMSYSNQCELLKVHGLYQVSLPDGTLYTYGTSWLAKDVPEHVLEWLYELPNTDRNPAWV